MFPALITHRFSISTQVKPQFPWLLLFAELNRAIYRLISLKDKHDEMLWVVTVVEETSCCNVVFRCQIAQTNRMACFAAFFRKKKRGNLRISRSQDQSPIQSPTVGTYWEFSYFYYNEETGKFEKAEACQSKSPGKRKELLLFVTCREKKPSPVKAQHATERCCCQQSRNSCDLSPM